jgi:MGT family glycosyltransferase
MHYGLVTLDLYGHLNPMTTLGAELARRGHRVTVLGSSRARPFADRAGLGWEPLNDTPEAAAGWDRLGELSGLAALKFTGGLVRQAVAATRAGLPGLVAAHGIDALVVDQFAPAAALVAEQIGRPYVVACNAIAVHVHPAVPPAPLNWKHRPGRLGRARNRLGNWLARTLFDRFAGAGDPDGVSPLMLADLDRKWGAAIVSQQPAGFDFPGHPRPAHFHYTAPWHAPGRDKGVPFPWDRLDGRPLVYASMGTLQNKLRHVYTAIAEAARGLDVQLVLSLGSPGADLGVRPPENVIVVPFAPQLELLDRSAAVITHAGLNTTLEALARGLPMVCLPVTNDQPGIARRVEYLGAGEVLGVGRARADRIRRRLTRVLEDPSYRMAAGRLRDQMRGLNGPAMAADVIEQATGARTADADVARPGKDTGVRRAAEDTE